jgi:hypothetical protein
LAGCFERVAAAFIFAADFFAALPADFSGAFLFAFLAVFLPRLFAARFRVTDFLAGEAIATGGTITGSETRPSAASGT